MSHGIDSDVKSDKDGAFMDVGDDTGIFSLDFAFAKVSLTGIAVYTFDIGLYGNVIQ